MPEEPKVVKYHPSSVDNLLVETLLRESKQKTLSSFLHKEFSCVPLQTAKDIEAKVGKDLSPATMTRASIHKLTQLLHTSDFPKPDASVHHCMLLPY
jgi:DNA topoisomerase VI subunit B